MIEELEAEDVDDDENQQPYQALFDEGCFRRGGHGKLELKINKGIGGYGEKRDEAGDKGIARNADGIWTAFACETEIGGEINSEQNDDGGDI